MARKQHAGISEQWKASLHRLEDAEALLAASRWRGAMYLAGYAVECRLKWKLMQRWRCHTLEQLAEKLATKGITDSPFTHSLELLFRWSEGYDRLRQDKSIGTSYLRVNAWLPAWRYSPDAGNHDEASRFLAAVKLLLEWIDHNL